MTDISGYQASQYGAGAQSLMRAAQTDAATLSRNGQSRAAAHDIAEQFEGMFLTSMLQTMFEQIPTDGLMGGGNGEKIWRSMQVQEYGTMIARNGGIGISDAVERQLLSLQEAPAQ